MSYSLESPCSKCTKEPECVDAQVIVGAIQTIHGLWKKGHLGVGTIRIDCHHLVVKPEPKEQEAEKPA